MKRKQKTKYHKQHKKEIANRKDKNSAATVVTATPPTDQPVAEHISPARRAFEGL